MSLTGRHKAHHKPPLPGPKNLEMLSNLTYQDKIGNSACPHVCEREITAILTFIKLLEVQASGTQLLVQVFSQKKQPKKTSFISLLWLPGFYNRTFRIRTK